MGTENWEDYVRLFSARGAPHYCWCTPHRLADHAKMTPDERKAAMRGYVENGIPIGVLAYEKDEPVGWCSIGPRESFAKLASSRTMPRVTSSETATWTVLCFFVPRTQRAKGVTRALLRGAVAYAKASGAQVVEGYPFDTAGISSTHRGHSSVFQSAGFEQDGSRWARTVR